MGRTHGSEVMGRAEKGGFRRHETFAASIALPRSRPSTYRRQRLIRERVLLRCDGGGARQSRHWRFDWRAWVQCQAAVAPAMGEPPRAAIRFVSRSQGVSQTRGPSSLHPFRLTTAGERGTRSLRDEAKRKFGDKY